MDDLEPNANTTAANKGDGASSISLGRPRYHVVAPRGWMNDPCAPGYIPSTGEFTLMYQWNPHSHLWDNISWGQMKSNDLVSWENVGEEPVFVPDQPYDCKGIFTGCFHPTSPTGEKDGLSIFYTSVPHIPIHWSWPHKRGQEGVALATSVDGGKTWQKDPSNPIVHAEPEHLYVTGFRDPSVNPWPTLDTFLGRPEGSGLYALISGGVQPSSDVSKDGPNGVGAEAVSTARSTAVGPRLFLYDLDPKDLKEWSYISTLGSSVPRGFKPNKWTGDFGTNWECATIFQLKDAASGEERDVCVLGVEGGGLRDHVQDYRKDNPDRPKRDARYAHWFFPKIKTKEVEHRVKEEQDVDIDWTTAGLVDWAELYAIATFPHPDGRRIGWGWLVELDVSPELAKEKGWTACLGLPREFGLKVYDGVVERAGGALGDVGSFDVLPGAAGTGAGAGKRVVTLGIAPLEELKSLRGDLIKLEPEGHATQMPQCYEVHLVASLETDSSFAVTLRSNATGSIRTRIVYSPKTEEIVIERGQSSPSAGICLQDERAPLTLLNFADGKKEKLDLRVFVDRDVIEVFANGRISLATRVYAPDDVNGFEMNVEGGNGAVDSCEAWEMGTIGLVR